MNRQTTHEIEAGRAMRPAEVAAPAAASTVKVWDPFVRTFHWSLVALFAVAFVTSETSETLHFAAGYGVLALVLLRLAWGLIGTRHARFSDFVYRPALVIGYVRDAARFRAKRYLGHNPAGGAMVVALLVALLTVSGTGVMMTMDRFWGQKWIEVVHEGSADATLALVALHILGVIYSSLEHRENLVRSMITGRKRR